MDRKFSPQLIARAQRIFKQRSGRFVSADEAELYLEQLAKLGNLATQLWKFYEQKTKK